MTMDCEIPPDRFASGNCSKVRGTEHDAMAIESRGNKLNLEGKRLGYLLCLICFNLRVRQVALTLDHSDFIDRLLAFAISHTPDLISIL